MTTLPANCGPKYTQCVHLGVEELRQMILNLTWFVTFKMAFSVCLIQNRSDHNWHEVAQLKLQELTENYNPLIN